MNQANGQAKLEIMSIVFNFTIAHVENAQNANHKKATH